MNCLFIYAHPDDETVAAGGTIRLLKDAGHTIQLVCVTAGQAGQVKDGLEDTLKQAGSIANLRRAELEQACAILGIDDHIILDFNDGEITNEHTWDVLPNALINQIETRKPDVVVTFDRTGWYYHLDHVAVAIATFRALEQTKHQPDLFILNHFHPSTIEDKWAYTYLDSKPYTHTVDISSVIGTKVAALEAHASQTFTFIDYLKAGKENIETFQVIKKSVNTTQSLNQLGLIEPAILFRYSDTGLIDN
jgi:LmbE family N-acetylglucosaminyl deacetylase